MGISWQAFARSARNDLVVAQRRLANAKRKLEEASLSGSADQVDQMTRNNKAVVEIIDSLLIEEEEGTG